MSERTASMTSLIEVQPATSCTVITPLLLRWRNPRVATPVEPSHQVPDFVNPFDMTSLDILIETYGLTISQKTRDNWRWLFPNTGYLRGFEDVFGSCFIHATDGLLAYFRVDDSGELFLGHLSNWIGPIDKEYVWDDDWNWEENKRIVNVFKRKDGSIVVIPKDTTMDIHWTKCQRMSKEEHELYAKLGREITLTELLEAEKHLAESPRPKTFSDGKTKSKRQLLLETL